MSLEAPLSHAHFSPATEDVWLCLEGLGILDTGSHAGKHRTSCGKTLSLGYSIAVLSIKASLFDPTCPGLVHRDRMNMIEFSLRLFHRLCYAYADFC